MRLRALSGLAILGLASALFAASGASADPIGGPYACLNGSCQGSIYLLEYDPTPVDTTPPLPMFPDGTETYRIILTIDTSGYDGGGVAIDAVAIKVASTLIGGGLIVAPFGVENWDQFINRGLNAAGCSESGSGFECARVTDGGTDPAVGGVLTWIWDLTVATGTPFIDPYDASVKVRYVDAAGAKVGALVSEPITLQPNSVIPIPEPSTFVLEGIGLIGFAIAARRTRRR